MIPDSLLDGVFNNGYPDEGSSHYLDTCGKYHSLSCHHSDDPDSLITPTQGKRDFGITAAIIVAIITGIAGATTAAVALTQTAAMAETINAVVSKSAVALQAQEVLNQHLYEAIHILQQQID